MPDPLDIEADLAVQAGSKSISVCARGRGVRVDTSSLAAFRELPRSYRGLNGLRRLAQGLAVADQAMTILSRGVPIIDIDSARPRRWLGRLLRVPGFRLYFFNWLRHRR